MKELKEKPMPEIAAADVIKIKNEDWRIDALDQDWAYAVRMETPHATKKFHLDDLLDGLAYGTYEKKEDIGMPPASYDVSGKDGAKMKKRLDALQWFLKEEYPDWEGLIKSGARNENKRKAAEKAGVSEDYFNKMLTRYLCSGCSRYSLMDGRRFNRAGTARQSGIRQSMGMEPLPERKEEADEMTIKGFTEAEILEQGFGYFRKSHNVEEAYLRILNDFYMERVVKNGKASRELVSKERRMPYIKLYRYIVKRLGGRKIRNYNKGSLNEKNNLRELTGTTRSGLTTVGQLFMMDETELGVYIVDSKTRRHVLGKAVVYYIVDAFSWAVVGVYVGFENNSYVGFCNAVASMLEPHENQTSRYGIHCTEAEFPSMVIPEEMIVDLGSEYRSKAVKRVAEPLGINLTFTSPGCGSMKGAVECTHKRLKDLLKKALRGCGQVEMEHDGSKKAKKEAVVTLETLRKMVYKSTLLLNSETLPGYSPTLEMEEAGIPLTPEDIWAYEADRLGTPVNMSSKDAVPILFDLMMDDREFEVDRSGIRDRKYRLFYRTDEPWFREMELAKGNGAEIRYDPEHVETVYVRYKKEIHAVPFAKRHEELESCKGLSWAEYRELAKQEAAEERKEQELRDKVLTYESLRSDVQTEKNLKNGEKNETDDIKDSRRKARRELRKDADEAKTRMENAGIENADIENADDPEPEAEDAGTGTYGTEPEEKKTGKIDPHEIVKHLYE